MESDFYIVEIQDECNFIVNFGIVNWGVDCDIKCLLIVEFEFFFNFKFCMNGWFMYDVEVVFVVLWVKQFYFWEDLCCELEDGEGYICLYLLFDVFGKFIQEVAVIFFGDQFIVVKGYFLCMEDVFFCCLQYYQECWEN